MGKKARLLPGALAAIGLVAWIGATLPAAAAAPSGFQAARQIGFPSGDDWEPAVAVDGSHVYAFWMHFGQPPDCPPLTGSSHMMFQASADGGKTWGPPHSIACQPEFGADAQLAVTTLPHGGHRLYASWMQSNQANSPIFVAFSDDFGGSWSAPVNATRLDHGGSGGDKDVLVARGREVWVTWEHLANNVVAHTPNIETTGFAPVSVPNPSGEVSLASGGGLDSHGNLYFTWGGVAQQGGANGPTTLWIGRSPDNGATWTTSTIDVSATAPAPSGAGWDYWGASTALAIIPRPAQATDRLVAVYNAGLSPDAPEKIFERYSDDNGATWSPRQELAPSADVVWHGFPAAIADAGGVRVTWMDNRNSSSFPTCQTDAFGSCGTWNVWYTTSADGATGWTPQVRLDGPAFTALAPHAYQSTAGFMHPYGDYMSMALDAGGHTYAVWGEGPDYAGPGSVWFTRS